jgi:hypothetical protein
MSLNVIAIPAAREPGALGDAGPEPDGGAEPASSDDEGAAGELDNLAVGGRLVGVAAPSDVENVDSATRVDANR